MKMLNLKSGTLFCREFWHVRQLLLTAPWLI